MKLEFFHLFRQLTHKFHGEDDVKVFLDIFNTFRYLDPHIWFKWTNKPKEWMTANKFFINTAYLQQEGSVLICQHKDKQYYNIKNTNRTLHMCELHDLHLNKEFYTKLEDEKHGKNQDLNI